jgi:regulator of sigma E protease
MILLLSLLILVHEAGHFFCAKALGFKVSKFGFGLPIGPTLWSKKIGDVEYLIHACLLGGYVAFPDDEKDSDVKIPEEDKFINQPVWKRMIVISAGVVANVIIAILLVIFTASVWGKLPSGNYKVYVNNIVAEKSASIWNSGIEQYDQIIKINDSDINSAYALTLYTKYSAKNDGKVDKEFVQKNFEELKRLNPNINPEETIAQNTSVILPQNRPDEPALNIDKEVLKGYTIYKNDEVELSKEQIKLRDSINKENKIISDGNIKLEDVAYALSDGLKPLNITVLRDGKEIKLNTIYSNEKGLIGIQIISKQNLIKTKNPATIIKGSISYLYEQTYMLVYGLWQLFTGKIPVKELHGIVVIAKIGGDVIHNSGIFSGLLLTAMISLDLALINFLPIPALDGGHFMFLLIEKLRGKPLNQETIDKISNIFFLLLIILMILIIFNDIYALIMHKL